MEKTYKLTLQQLTKLCNSYSEYEIDEENVEKNLKEIEIQKKIKAYEDKLRKKR